MDRSSDGHPPSSSVPLVTVLVAAYNAEQTIGAAIASVLATRGVAVDCLVVDDGSTDRTVEVVRAVADGDPRVRLIALPANEGVSAARNRGLPEVRGAWLTFLDADDRLLPGGIEALVAPTGGRAEPREDAPLAVVGQRVWSDGTRTWVSAFYDIPDIRQPGRASIAARPGLLYYASLTGKLFHRSCWDGLTFEGRVLGDQPWTIRALLRADDRIEVIGDVVYEWRRPAPGEPWRSITSVTRASVAPGVEATQIASRALVEVAAEANARLPPEDARRVAAAYLERLVRSDLGMHLARALRRRDPEVGRLFDAFARFVSAVPDGLLEGSAPLTRDLLEPPLTAWLFMPAGARTSYRGLLVTAERASPGVADRATDALRRLALRRLLAGGRGAGPVLAAIGVQHQARRVIRGVRRRARSFVRRGPGPATPDPSS